MRRSAVLLLSVCFAAVIAPDIFARQPSVKWPGGRQAAIVLTYDDALPSQLDIAIPQLGATGLRARSS